MTHDLTTWTTVSLLVKKDSMSHEGFVQHWRSVHAPLVRKVPGIVAYSQLSVREAGALAQLVPTFDGIAVIQYESREAMRIAWDSEPGRAAMEDVENFIGERTVIAVDEYEAISRRGVEGDERAH